MRFLKHRLLLVELVSMVLACSDEPVASKQGEERAASVPYAWTGCEDYVEASCVLIHGGEPPSLTIWADVPFGLAWKVLLDGVETQARSREVDGGTQLVLEVPPGTSGVLVESEGLHASLEVIWHHRGPSVAAVISARGDVAEMCRLLDGGPEGLRGRDLIDWMGLSNACVDADDHATRLGRLEQLAEAADANALRRSFVRAASGALWMRLERSSDSSSARKWLARMSQNSAGLADLEVWTDYARVLLARREGSTAQALEAAERAMRWASRLSMSEEFRKASEARATLLAELGRAAESRAMSRSLLRAASEATAPCDEARIIHNATWTQQVLADAGLEHDPPLADMLREAEIYESGACKSPRDRLIGRINVATAALSEGDVELAASWSARIQVEDRSAATGELDAQLEYLEIGIALESNRWDDVDFPLLTRARSSSEGDARMRWRATVREAQVLERFGLELAATDAWRRAESLLDEDAAAVGVSSGRESFISGRTTSAIGLVEALLRQRDPEQALCRARIARGRALRRAVRDRGAASAQIGAFDAFLHAREQLERDASEDWGYAGDELSRRIARREEKRRAAMNEVAAAFPDVAVPDSDCAALRPRATDEVLLLLLPTRDDTLVIASAPSGMLVRRAPTIPEDVAAMHAWAEAMLADISPALVGATLVRALPVGRAWSVPIHAITFDGAPLVERLAVTYGLDLPAGQANPTPSSRALVVADPTGDLPHAMSEGTSVDAALRTHGLAPELLTGPTAARSDVLTALGRADLFHYAGHGEHRGSDGWDDALLLHERASIEAADVLALASAPRTVVLAGCETGAVNAGLFDGGMSLGRAFLLAGSDAVVVGDREVADDVTQTFAVALYDGPPERIFAAPEQAVREALRTTAKSGAPPSWWSGFRLLVR